MITVTLALLQTSKLLLAFTNVSAGDSIGIGTETMRIINAFPSEKIVRVERYAGFTAATGLL